jgi:hypothetical protein
MIRVNFYVGKKDIEQGSTWKSRQHPVELAIKRRLALQGVDVELWEGWLIFTRTTTTLPVGNVNGTLDGRFVRDSRYTVRVPKKVAEFCMAYPAGKEKPLRFYMDLPLDFA